MFQSPSLRGSGRFPPPPKGGGRSVCMFQSPSLRGSGRFEPSGSRTSSSRWLVSIPFIAGQWSLLDELEEAWEPDELRFNPLHCGAVVASSGPQPWATSCSGCFNPLHCGAVVASVRRKRGKPQSGGFQSPSLRGSGRFARPNRAGETPPPCFNPLHCGAVVASLRTSSPD